MLRHIAIGTAAVALTLGLAACGSDSDSSSSTTTSGSSSKDAVCQDKDALKQSIRDLTNLDLASAGKGTIDSDAKDVQNNLDSLGDSVKANLKPQVDALKSAVQDLKDAIKGFGDGSISQSIKDTGDAISKVGESGADLATALDTQCKT